MTESQLLFASDLHREFKLPESTWRYWHYTDKLRAAKLGRRLVWKRVDVVRFLAEQGVDVGSD